MIRRKELKVRRHNCGAGSVLRLEEGLQFEATGDRVHGR